MRTIRHLTVMHLILGPMAVSLLMPSASAAAQTTDLSAIRCGEFATADARAAADVMLWLSGYFTYEDDPTVIDPARQKAKEGQVKAYCADHKDLALLEAAEIFMDKKYGR